MRRQPTSPRSIWPIPAWVLALGGLVLFVFLIACYILFWPRHPGAPKGGPTARQTAQLAPPSRLRHPAPATQAKESDANPAPAPSSSTPIPPPPVTQWTVPADTELMVRTSALIDSNADPVGSRFPGTIVSPVAINGQTVVPQGSAVVLHLVNKKKTGFFHRSLAIQMALAGISVNGRIYPVQAGILSLKAGQNNSNSNDGKDSSPAPKGKKALVILPNTEMNFTLTAPLMVVSASPAGSNSVNSGKDE